MHTPDHPLCLRDIETLFRPFHYRKLTLPSRLVMAPMTRGFAPGGIPTPEMAQYYERRAREGLGLIITEGTLINEPSASADSNYPDFFSGAALRAWRHIARRVQRHGCRMAPQLWHMGMARPLPHTADMPNPELPPIGPSGIDPQTLEETGETMSRAKIAEVIAAFAQAAAHARRLGFDAVEIHGAHGYLIDQFFWEATNRRTDEYGGDLVGRTRFAREVVTAVRKAVGRRFPIIFRFSQWKVGQYGAKLARTPAELSDLLHPLCEAGVDIFHCSTRTFSTPEFEGSARSLAGWVKRLTGKPTIAVGSVGLDKPFLDDSGENPRCVGIRRLVEMMAAGEFDLIAIGRSLLADPAWATKVRMGLEEEIMPFTQRSLGRLY